MGDLAAATIGKMKQLPIVCGFFADCSTRHFFLSRTAMTIRFNFFIENITPPNFLSVAE